jgi:hypothetical protein
MNTLKYFYTYYESPVNPIFRKVMRVIYLSQARSMCTLQSLCLIVAMYMPCIYSKTMFLVLNQVYYSEFKSNTHKNYNYYLKLNEIILIRNYLQPRKKHQAS